MIMTGLNDNSTDSRNFLEDDNGVYGVLVGLVLFFWAIIIYHSYCTFDSVLMFTDHDYQPEWRKIAELKDHTSYRFSSRFVFI